MNRPSTQVPASQPAKHSSRRVAEDRVATGRGGRTGPDGYCATLLVSVCSALTVLAVSYKKNKNMKDLQCERKKE